MMKLKSADHTSWFTAHTSCFQLWNSERLLCLFFCASSQQLLSSENSAVIISLTGFFVDVFIMHVLDCSSMTPSDGQKEAQQIPPAATTRMRANSRRIRWSLHWTRTFPPHDGVWELMWIQQHGLVWGEKGGSAFLYRPAVARTEQQVVQRWGDHQLSTPSACQSSELTSANIIMNLDMNNQIQVK